MGLGSFVFLSQEGVQTKIAQNFTQSLNQQWNTDFKIKKAAIRWNGNIQLNDFIVRDHHLDTLLYIGQLETSLLSFQEALDGDLQFSDVQLQKGRLQIVKYAEDSLHSLDIFLQKFKHKSPRKKPLWLRIDQLKGTNFQIEIKEYSKDSTRQSLEELNFEGRQIELRQGSFAAQIKSLDFRYNNRQATVFGKLNYTPNQLSLEEFKFSYDSMNWTGEIEIRDWLTESPSIDFQCTGSIQDLSDWYSSTDLVLPRGEQSIFLSGNGTLNHLKIADLQWKSMDHSFDGKLEMDLKKRSVHAFQLFIESLQFESSYIQSMAPALSPDLRAVLAAQTEIKGLVRGANDSLQHSLDLNSSNFKLASQGNLIFNTSLKPQKFVASWEGYLHPQQKTKYLPETLKLQANTVLTGFQKTPKLEFDGSFQARKFFNHDEFVGDFDGDYLDKRLKLQWKNRTDKGSIELLAQMNLGDPMDRQSVTLLFLGLDPKAYSIDLGSRPTGLNGYVKARWRGFDWDRMEGDVLMDQFSIKSGDTVVVFKPLELTLKKMGRSTRLAVKSEDILSGQVAGEFQLSQTQALIRKTANEAFPFLFPVSEAPKGQLKFNFNLDQKILKALYPDIQALQNFSCNGIISDQNQQSRLRVQAPYFSMGDFKAYNFDFRIENKNILYNAYVHADSVKTKSVRLNRLDIISKQIKDTLYFKGETSTTGNFKSRWNINAFQSKGAQGEIVFGIRPSQMSYLGKQWDINPMNRSKPLLYLNTKGVKYALDGLEFQHQKEKIVLSGEYENPQNLDVSIGLEQVQIASLWGFSDVFDVQGLLSAQTKIVRSPAQQGVRLDLQWNELNINREDLGQLDLKFVGNLETETFQYEIKNTNQSKIPFEVKGSGLGWENPALDMTLSFSRFPIDFISPLGRNKITNIEGDMSGDINIWGPLDRLEQLGQLKFHGSSLSLPYTQVDYSFEDNGQVDLIDQRFLIRGVQVKDTKNNTLGLLKGSISHENFYKWFLDLSLDTDRLLIIDRENEPNALFYGPGYFKGNAQLKGYTKTLQLQLKGETEQGTSIVIPYDEDYTVADVSFIDFVDKNRLEEVVETEEVLLEKLRGLEMQFDLDINQAAQIEIVMDPASGSSLKGRGTGNLLMEVNTNGKFNMWGDYIATEGIYNFQNLGLIDKKFNLKSGGTIVWEGDPLEAQMNLEAIYEVPGGANPAVLLDNPNFSQKIPTQVGIQLQGNLLKPDDPNFTIEFPNTNQTVSSEINYRLADDQRRQLQAISLLSQGIFINDVSLSVEGLTNNLYEKASDIFSNIVGQENEKLKVGLNYLQGDETLTQQLYAEDRLGLTLKTQISDRILVNGRIGVPVGGVEQTLLVGDVQIDFILSEDGSLRAKVFNKENEFRYLSDRLGYTQGIGLNYQVDFETFQELIRKIVQKEQGNVKD